MKISQALELLIETSTAFGRPDVDEASLQIAKQIAQNQISHLQYIERHTVTTMTRQLESVLSDLQGGIKE